MAEALFRKLVKGRDDLQVCSAGVSAATGFPASANAAGANAASHTAGMPRQPVDPFTALLFLRYLATLATVFAEASHPSPV